MHIQSVLDKRIGKEKEAVIVRIELESVIKGVIRYYYYYVKLSHYYTNTERLCYSSYCHRFINPCIELIWGYVILYTKT